MAMQLSFSQMSEAGQSQGGTSGSQRLTCAFSSGCRLGTPAPLGLDLSLTDSEGQEILVDATNLTQGPPVSQMHSQLTSQQLLSTQDFVTPVDPPASQQWRGTPAQLSPNRNKRPRQLSDLDEDAQMDFSQSQQGAMGPPGPQLPPTAHKSKMLRRARSPPCLRNVFETRTVAEDNSYNASISSLPRQQRELPDRYRSEFKEVRLLGEGNFSVVRAAKHRLDGVEYAIKRSTRDITDAASKQQWVQEIHAWARLGSHPNVVRYYGSWFEHGSRGGEHAYIQLEKCGMKLSEHANLNGPLSETDLVDVLGQLAAALQHVHSYGMVHMDVKPDNVYVCDDGTVKLGDFGLATVDSDDTNSVQYGSGDARYVAKEVLQADDDDVRVLEKADMFALGASLYELASGKRLPKGGKAFHDLREGKLFLPHHSGPFQHMLKSLVHPEPRQRHAPRYVMDWVAKRKQHQAACNQAKAGCGSRTQLSLQPSQASAAAAG